MDETFTSVQNKNLMNRCKCRFPHDSEILLYLQTKEEILFNNKFTKE